MIVGPILLVVIIANKIELPLPEGTEEYGTITGNILHCDFSGNNEAGLRGSPEVGITLENARSIYLRWNTQGIDTDYIDALCESRKKISVSYKVNRTIISPGLSYWAETIREQ